MDHFCRASIFRDTMAVRGARGCMIECHRRKINQVAGHETVQRDTIVHRMEEHLVRPPLGVASREKCSPLTRINFLNGSNGYTRGTSLPASSQPTTSSSRLGRAFPSGRDSVACSNLSSSALRRVQLADASLFVGDQMTQARTVALFQCSYRSEAGGSNVVSFSASERRRV